MPLLDPPDEVIVEEGMSDDDEEQLDHASAPQQHKAARKTSKPAKQRSKGVVYISRIPPHLASTSQYHSPCFDSSSVEALLAWCKRGKLFALRLNLCCGCQMFPPHLLTFGAASNLPQAVWSVRASYRIPNA